MTDRETKDLIETIVKKHLKEIETNKQKTRIKTTIKLEKYKKAKEKYQTLENQLIGVHSIDYNYVKSTVHNTLIDLIHKKDKAYKEMVNSYRETFYLISHFVPFPEHFLLMDLYIENKSINEVRKKYMCTTKEFNEILNNALDYIIID